MLFDSIGNRRRVAAFWVSSPPARLTRQGFTCSIFDVCLWSSIMNLEFIHYVFNLFFVWDKDCPHRRSNELGSQCVDMEKSESVQPQSHTFHALNSGKKHWMSKPSPTNLLMTPKQSCKGLVNSPCELPAGMEFWLQNLWNHPLITWRFNRFTHLPSELRAEWGRLTPGPWKQVWISPHEICEACATHTFSRDSTETEFSASFQVGLQFETQLPSSQTVLVATTLGAAPAQVCPTNSSTF